jgi:glutaredoxin
VYEKYVSRESVSHDHNDMDSTPVTIHKTGTWVKHILLVLGLICILSIFSVWKYQYKYKQSDHEEGNSDSSASVIIYTTPRCKYCNLAKSLLRKYHIDYYEYDVTSSQEGLRQYRELNGRGVPLIFIGETRMDGYSESALRSALKQEGLL